MQIPTKFMGLAIVLVLLGFSPSVSAGILWEGDVPAWSSTDDPTFVETIQVDAGTTLSISAALDDEWRLWAEDYPYWPLSKTINADGYPGFEIDGLPLGALVGKIGETGELFFIGTVFDEAITETGTLYLACWDYSGMYDDNDDAIYVTISGADEFHPADFDHDNDVDGADLAIYIGDLAAVDVSEFALAFGTAEETDNANLSDLALSAGTLSPVFSTGRSDYVVTVDNGTAEISLTPELDDPLASLTINDIDATSGVPFPISLDTGGNFIRIAVTSQDGSVVKDYSIIAVRTGQAALSALTLTSCDLNPAFSPAIDVYDIDVAAGVESVEITAETDDPASLITINGIGVTSGSALLVSIIEGINEIDIEVTATDDSVKRYFVFIRHTGTAAETVYVVDEALAPDQFETLTGAVNHLNASLAPGEIGEIRIQTTHPMQVDALTITADMFIIVEPGASNVVAGPSATPLVIDAVGGCSISGLSFTNSPGYTINAARGLSVLGSSFAADTVVNISGSSALHASDWSFGQGWLIERGNISGDFNVNLQGNIDANTAIVGTFADKIAVYASGVLSGSAGLRLENDPTSEINVKATLEANAHVKFAGLTGMNLLKSDTTMNDNASVRFENSVAGKVEFDCGGVKGLISAEQVVAADTVLGSDMNEFTYNGEKNTFTNFLMNFSSDFAAVGFSEKGGHVFGAYEFHGENGLINAQAIAGFDNMTFNNIDFYLRGLIQLTLENGTVVQGEAMVRLKGLDSNFNLSDLEAKGKFSVFLPDSNTQFYLAAESTTFHKGFYLDTATDQVSGKMDHSTIVSFGVAFIHDIGGTPTPDTGGNPPRASGNAGEAPADAELVFDHLTISATDQPGLYIEGVAVPVTITNSTINGGIWAIACVDIDADVTIANNPNLTGGIRFDGDPDLAGSMIDRQYTVSTNTITQNHTGGSCLSSHAIRNITASNNTMTAGAFASHGIHLNGGKMLVDGGSIITCGPTGGCNAIGVMPSAGGANAVLYADNVNPITGNILPSTQGYVKLTNNTFLNALVVDLGEEPRLLNDPVSDNTGLDPDADVVGSLIDWNDDIHHCPDYPTRCDEWDDDDGQCGCGHDGLDPPVEPGI